MKIRLSFLILTVLFALSLAHQKCEFDLFQKLGEYKNQHGRDVSYYYNPDFKVNWYTALTLCKAHSMELATIESKEEEHYLLGKIHQTFTNKRFFIGGTNAGHGTSWYWASTGMPINYGMKWASGQPSPNEHCLEIWPHGKWTMNNIPCDHKFMFICEKTKKGQ